MTVGSSHLGDCGKRIKGRGQYLEEKEKERQGEE